jgi:Ca-activated chloride channel family protein
MTPKVVVIILMALFLSGCGSTPPPSISANSGQQVTEQKKETKVWPDVIKTDKPAPVSLNLMAKNFVLVFDGSGSMGDTSCGGGRPRIESAKDVALTWIQSVPKDANIGLVAFHTRQGTWTKIDLTSDRRKITEALQSVRAGGNTPLATAFSKAFTYLTLAGQSQLGYGEYTLVTITDGEADNIGALSEWVEFILRTTPIQIYTIGFCIHTNHTLYQPGRTDYRSANSPEELARGLQDVLAEAENFDVKDFNR